MKIEKQLNSSHPRLLLFFAGWSASPESFTGLKAENGTDILPVRWKRLKTSYNIFTIIVTANQ